MRLSIGTAQFGRDYGIANHGGQIRLDEINNIFKIAMENNIETFDTAEDYGHSEKIIGNTGKALDMNTKIITKTFINDDHNEFKLRLQKSLSRLKKDSVYGLLVHDPNTLIEDKSDKIFSILSEAKECGLAEKIGVSVSTPDQARAIFNKYNLDIIQVPCNLLDQRFLSSNIIRNFAKEGVEVHIRSVFLQGLFFIDTLDTYFDDLKDIMFEIKSIANKNFTSIRKMALSFAKSIAGVDKIIVGVDNACQLTEIIDDYNAEATRYNFDRFSISDDRFINPACWPVGGWHNEKEI